MNPVQIFHLVIDTIKIIINTYKFQILGALATIVILGIIGIGGAPLLLLAAFFYGRSQAAGIQKTIKNKDNKSYSIFWLDADEAERVIRLTEHIGKAREEITQAEKTANEENLRRDKTGRISAENDLGRLLSAAIDENRAILESDVPAYDTLVKTPGERRKRFVRNYSVYVAGFWGLITWMTIAVLAIMAGGTLEQFLLFFQHGDSPVVVNGAALAALIVGLAGLIVGRIRGSFMAKKSLPATAENCLAVEAYRRRLAGEKSDARLDAKTEDVS
jgi:hypothetical protein